MSVLKYKDPVTGEVKKVGAPSVEGYTKQEVDAKMAAMDNKLTSSLATKAPAYTYGTSDLTAGQSALETGKLYFVYE